MAFIKKELIGCHKRNEFLYLFYPYMSKIHTMVSYNYKFYMKATLKLKISTKFLKATSYFTDVQATL
jgi:hypothetical protein